MTTFAPTLHGITLVILQTAASNKLKASPEDPVSALNLDNFIQDAIDSYPWEDITGLTPTEAEPMIEKVQSHFETLGFIL